MAKVKMTDVELRELAFLVNAIDKAKKAKKSAEADLVLAESKVAARIQADKDAQINNRNSQRTIPLLDGRKVVVARKFNVKTDIEGMKTVVSPIPLPIKEEKKEVLDLEGYEWYRVNDQVTFIRLSQFVRVTPAKASITIKPPKE